MGVLSPGAIATGGITGLFYVIRLKHGIIVIGIKWEIRQLHEGLLSPLYVLGHLSEAVLV